MLQVKTIHHDRITIISLAGELIISTIQDAEKIWEAELNKDIKLLAFNCKKLKIIDSTSIGTFVKLYKICEEKNIRFLFYNMPSDIHQLFVTTRLDSFFTIYSEQELIQEYPELKD